MPRARQPVRQCLAEVVQELPPELQSRALADIEVIDPEGTLDIESLANLIRDRFVPSDRRATAAWVAGQIRERSLAPLLENTVMSEESPTIVWEAAKSLCSMGQGLEVVRRLLQAGKSPELRKVGAYALGCLGAVQFVPSRELCGQSNLKARSEQGPISRNAAGLLMTS